MSHAIANLFDDTYHGRPCRRFTELIEAEPLQGLMQIVKVLRSQCFNPCEHERQAYIHRRMDNICTVLASDDE